MKLKFLLIPISLIFLTQLVSAQYVWDIFRPIIYAAESIDAITRFIVLILAVIIFAISLLAYYRVKTKRLALVSIAFFLFAVDWVIKVIDLFASPGNFFGQASENVLEFLILLFLAIAIFYRKKGN